jgi:hypothetical protein
MESLGLIFQPCTASKTHSTHYCLLRVWDGIISTLKSLRTVAVRNVASA